MITMVYKNVCDGHVGHYNLIDWRSWKLPRIARSSLSAESQACSECADSLLFACSFWKLFWLPELYVDNLSTPTLPHPPSLVIDAKALYDLLIKDEIQAACGTRPQDSNRNTGMSRQTTIRRFTHQTRDWTASG